MCKRAVYQLIGVTIFRTCAVRGWIQLLRLSNRCHRLRAIPAARTLSARLSLSATTRHLIHSCGGQ